MEHNFAKSGIVLDEELELNIPKDRKITLKTQPGVEAKITDENGRRTYLWTSSHRERDDQDSDKPKKPKKKQPESPSVQMTTFSSWEEVGRWYGSLEKDRRAPSEEIRKRAGVIL